MVEKREKRSSVMINRAPVLTLWAAVVALLFTKRFIIKPNTFGCGNVLIVENILTK
jgi:hypothetical protein